MKKTMFGIVFVVVLFALVLSACAPAPKDQYVIRLANGEDKNFAGACVADGTNVTCYSAWSPEARGRGPVFMCVDCEIASISK